MSPMDDYKRYEEHDKIIGESKFSATPSKKKPSDFSTFSTPIYVFSLLMNKSLNVMLIKICTSGGAPHFTTPMNENICVGHLLSARTHES